MATNPPLVSIIMPTYNRAPLIMDSIESIRSQSFTDWELIIIDDGSTDETASLVQSLNDPRINYFPTTHTGSLGMARNEGIKYSRCQFLAFQDSDDLWHPQKLELQVQALQQQPEAGFCLTNGFNFIETGTPLEYFYKNPVSETAANLFEDCFQSKVASFAQALMFRKSCLDKTGWLQEGHNTDRNFIVALAFHFKGIILNAPLVQRRLHEAGHHPGNWENSYRYEAAMIMSHRQHLPEQVWRKALFSVYMNYGDKLRISKLRQKALGAYLSAFRIKPAFSAVKKIISLIFS